MKLTEVFDKPAPIKWVKEGESTTGAFTAGKEDYVAYISPTVAWGEFGMYRVERTK